jgi:hypothetical protein
MIGPMQAAAADFESACAPKRVLRVRKRFM